MKFNIPDKAYEDIVKFAEKWGTERVILFGSRARGTHRERSDIDIAVSGGNFSEFYWDVEDNARTLLCFDIVNTDSGISGELQKEIDRDGRILYERNDVQGERE
ncbi:MAG: nucleotidyltransferase domain-containing protein [Ruminococcus sp.]|nr:nucleotidyltransferase domain-containing protein [Ruminococcus sp.]